MSIPITKPVVPPTNAWTGHRETYHNHTTQFRISFIVYLCLVYLLQSKGGKIYVPL